MCKKLICLMVFVLVMGLASNASAQLIFSGAADDGGIWVTPGNWVGGVAPTSTDSVNLTYNGPDPTVYAATATCARLLGPGYSGDRNLHIDGGTLTITGTAFAVAMNAGDNGIVNMSNSATIDCTNAGGNVTIGNRGYGTLNMTGSSAFDIAASMHVGEKDTTSGAGIVNMDGGSTIDIAVYLYVGKLADATGTVNIDGGSTIDVGGALLYGDDAGATGYVNLIDGTLTCDRFYSRYGTGVMNITGGVFEIVGDEETKVGEYIADGRIVAHGGSGTVLRDYDIGTDITTVWAGFYIDPDPADGDLDVFPTVELLSWTNPEPDDPGSGVITCDAYFGTDEPNMMDPPPYGLTQLVFDEEVNSMDVTLSAETTYYWIVNCFDSSTGMGPDPVASGSFTFATNNGNIAPVVDAGSSVRTWLTGGSVDVTLAGAILEDDGIPVAATTLWSVLSQPDEGGAPATFIPNPPVNLDSVITMTVTGDYVLQLEADDTEKTGTDTMTISVYENACAAAVTVPGFEFYDGDIDEDCDVNLMDFAILASEWLENNALVNNYLY